MDENKTDVSEVWKKHGWTPPSEQQEVQAKWEATKKPIKQELNEILEILSVEEKYFTCRPLG
jgi:hypothetical protein